QEKLNAEFFTRLGAGCLARNARQAVEITADLLDAPEKLRAMSQATEELYAPGAQRIIDAILG
ncbi:MAG: UDP-N-acetylglucosamine--LPS N-acetylglucosamine transferase, partial [Phycisphaerae bacterium]|nr:UDP-N-acetylglucosamine--LPS N-acetylglucosamine transferase [Phycisphaerae bacterium]